MFSTQASVGHSAYWRVKESLWSGSRGRSKRETLCPWWRQPVQVIQQYNTFWQLSNGPCLRREHKRNHEKKMKLPLKYVLPKLWISSLRVYQWKIAFFHKHNVLIFQGGFATQRRHTGSLFYLTLAQLAPLSRWWAPWSKPTLLNSRYENMCKVAP